MDGKQKNNTKLIMIGVISLSLCVIVVLAGVCLKLYSDMKKNEGSNANNGIVSTAANQNVASGNGIVVTEDTRDAVSGIRDKVEKGKIAVRMTQHWVFEEGGASSNAYLANSTRNSYPLRFEITLAETGEVIMQSPDVPVGSCIENFPLSVTLEPGTYDVIVAHQQVEDGEVINTVSTAEVITVK